MTLLEATCQLLTSDVLYFSKIALLRILHLKRRPKHELHHLSKRSASHEKHFARDADANGTERYAGAPPAVGDDLQDDISTEYRISHGDYWVEPFARRGYRFTESGVKIRQQQHTIL